MAKPDSFIVYLQEEVFRHISGIFFRPMFGGYGIYRHGRIFGLVADDTVYFKVGPLNLSDYQLAGSQPFIYSKNGQPYTMSYWQVPESVLVDSVKLELWVDKSLRVKK